jgi:hypothetical protein
MKKNVLLFIFTIMSTSLMAFSQILPLTVIGKGGTTTGDKVAACAKAQSRANIDITSSCISHNGKLIDLNFSACSCHKKPGSKDDYNCDITAFGKCQLAPTHHYEQFIGTGVMNTVYGDTARACFFAQDRALREAQNRCNWVYGQPVSHQFSPCNCVKIPGPNYEYSCRVDAYLQCRVQ